MKQNSQLYKGSLSTIILKLLSQNDKMYGYEITKAVHKLSEGSLVLTEGALYPSLHKLEAEGILTTTVETIGNRQRKYYLITKHGKKEFILKLKAMEEYFNQMQKILQLKPAI